MELIDSFEATRDDGSSETIHVWAKRIEGRYRDGDTIGHGNEQLRTTSGSAVNVISKGVYEVLQTGKRLRSSASNAR